MDLHINDLKFVDLRHLVASHGAIIFPKIFLTKFKVKVVKLYKFVKRENFCKHFGIRASRSRDLPSHSNPMSITRARVPLP